jgi:hypothetical protein
MGNALYPVLPGQTWPRLKTPRFTTLVKRAQGRRYALSQQLYPTYVIRINYSFLRAADLDTLSGFFRARRGRADDFLFDDRDDNTAVDQVFALGNGISTSFQLARASGGFVEPVYALNGAPIVKVAGSTASVTVGNNGIVTFASPQLTWSGAYYQRVAFTKDEMELEEFMRRLYVAKQVEFETFHP